MATIPVNKDFWDLKGGVYELTPQKDGDAALGTHIVMFVGYGMKDGRLYLVFLNSYGTGWGTRGLGRVYFDHVFQLDFKGFQFIRVNVNGHNNAPTPHHERAFRPDQMQSCGYMSLAGQRSATGKGGCSTVCTNARAERTSKSMAFQLSKTLLPKFKHINQEEKAFALEDASGTACGADPGNQTR